MTPQAYECDIQPFGFCASIQLQIRLNSEFHATFLAQSHRKTACMLVGSILSWQGKDNAVSTDTKVASTTTACLELLLVLMMSDYQSE